MTTIYKMGASMKESWEVWNDILTRSESCELTAEEVIINQVNVFLVDFEMGGWLYNRSPEVGRENDWSDLRATADAVEAVGVPLIAEVLRRITAIVESSDAPGATTWGEFLDRVDPDNAIGKLEQQIRSEFKTLYAVLDEFTVKHFHCKTSC